ncbi:terminal uridylyltransferase Tailor-like [Malaya genurostris]|uniref:terminal uridylyltransferase Tailor-like n=1 Tax=Malaya genurostris TaxID=325434 RepID=UPI0026F3CA8A|nr:terminal uridylyltransferase Tailor-like [Malaya genurostris]
MAFLHLQLFVRRFNDLADDYLRRVSWIAEPAVEPLQMLQRAVREMGSKQRIRSARSQVFYDWAFEKDILHFLRPVECCGKALLHTSALIPHLLNGDHADCALDDGAKRLLIMFNLYIQTMNDILVRYDSNYECVDQLTAEYLAKAADFISCILRKPVCVNAVAQNFFVRTHFRKWKVVFDYTCRPCADDGVKRCHLHGAIAWYMIHASTLKANPILHLESQLHATSIRKIPLDHVELPRELNNNSNAAAMYLLAVKEMELDKKSVLGRQIALSTPFEAVESYLKRHLSKALGGMTVRFFGSRVTGLAEADADLDVWIKSQSGQNDKTALNKAIAWASANPDDVREIFHIFERPTLIRVNVRSLNLKMDLTFGSCYVVANSELIKYFLELQPLASKLFFCLKEWKKLAEISLNFANHMLIMLIVFFMQQKQYLPPVDKLLVGPIIQNGSFNTNFRRSIPVGHATRPKDLLTLMRGFFNYWSQFDWTQYGICLLDGQVKPKQWFNFATDRTSIPPMMSSDYFEQTRNTAGNIKSGDYQKFMNACHEAVEVMKIKVM